MVVTHCAHRCRTTSWTEDRDGCWHCRWVLTGLDSKRVVWCLWFVAWCAGMGVRYTRKRRMTIALAFPLLIFAIYVGRLVWLQGVKGEEYLALKASRIESETVLPAARGEIVDCDGTCLSGDRAGVRVRLKGNFSREEAAVLLQQLGETVTDSGDVLCTDVSEKTAATIREQPNRYAGLLCETVPIREYKAKDLAPHLLGTVGPIYAEEYEQLKQKGYHLTDYVGKSGLEAAMEEVLRGQDGKRVVRSDGGKYERAAIAGNTVELTLDSVLQREAQNALSDTIKRLKQQFQPLSGQDVRSGSAVLLRVRDGGVLACASYPTYDLSTYFSQYNALIADETQPLFNRALYGTFACGSVIKPAVAVAGLSQNITVDVRCEGVYRYYEDVGFAPKCMGVHGAISVVTALQKSCNVYFMEMGRLLGIERLNQTATAFGLGQKSGIEVGEARGVLASPATKKGVWVAGDTCQCAIGQFEQRFTPIQLAAYAMTLANKGIRYRTHLVNRVLRYDKTPLQEYQPEILSTVTMSDAVMQSVHEGMEQVVKKGGTAYEAFRDAPYTLAAKTGTAQTASNRSDHGVFIAYAPAEYPEVALAVVMENGTSKGAYETARRILDAYFNKYGELENEF